MNKACLSEGRNISKLSLVTGGLIGIAAMTSGVLIGGSSVFADTDNVSVIVPISCTMNSTGNNSHTTEINNGRYVSEIGTTTLKVVCNDSAGFSIYAAGFTGDEIGGTNSTKLVGSNNGGLISTGTATGSNSSDPSNWAMKLTTDSTAAYPITLQNGYGNYSAVPSSYTKVATRLQGTDGGTNAVGSTLTTTYAAYIDSTQTTDTYIGQVKYTLVHPASEVPLQPQPSTAGCINYHANASTAEGTMGCQSATDNASVTLLASNFSRTGYGFAGWSDKYDYATNASAKFYGPQETIAAPVGTTASGLSLYAVWVKSEGSLQDTTKVAELCGTGSNALTTAPTDGTANLNSVSALTDSRDNQTYAIAKLADGKCWMIENLRLENTNSDNATGTLAQGYNTSFAGLADPEAASLFTSTATANTLYSTDGSTDKTISGSNQGYRFPRYNNVNTPTTATDRPSNPTTNSSTNSTSNAGMYSYGNYYTWSAAIADTTAYTTNNQSVTSTSICPSGWHLPIGGRKANVDVSDFWKLSRATIGADPANFSNDYFYYTGTPEGTAASNKLRAYPNNFVYSGYVYSGSVYDRGSTGFYWSSTAYSSNYAYYSSLNSSYVYPGTNSSNKYLGRAVRCVASGS